MEPASPSKSRKYLKAAGLGVLWLATIGAAFVPLVGLTYGLGLLPELFGVNGSAHIWWSWGLRTVIALVFGWLVYWLLFHPRRSLLKVQRVLNGLSQGRLFKHLNPALKVALTDSIQQTQQLEHDIEQTTSQPQGSLPLPGPVSRRRFLLETTAIGGFVLETFYLEPSSPQLTRLEVKVPNLPPAFEGFTIAQLSDIHLDPYTSAAAIETMVAQTQALRPDMVVVTGDFVSRGNYYFEQAARTLGALRDGTRLGLYGVSGNHDHWADGDDLGRLEPLLRKHGLPLLRNSATRLELSGDRLWLLGTDDSSTHNADWKRTLRAAGFESAEAARRREEPLLVLSHNPAFTAQLLPAEPNLVLAGHTHGGQVYLPGLEDFLISPIFPQFNGAYRVGARTQVYVNRGAGVVGPPMRLLARPEILLLRLLKA